MHAVWNARRPRNTRVHVATRTRQLGERSNMAAPMFCRANVGRCMVERYLRKPRRRNPFNPAIGRRRSGCKPVSCIWSLYESKPDDFLASSARRGSRVPKSPAHTVARLRFQTGNTNSRAHEYRCHLRQTAICTRSQPAVTFPLVCEIETKKRQKRKAGVVQWQNGSFPSCIRGFEFPSPAPVVFSIGYTRSRRTRTRSVLQEVLQSGNRTRWAISSNAKDGASA